MEINSDNIIKYVGEELIMNKLDTKTRVVVTGVEHNYKYPHGRTKAIVKKLNEEGDTRYSVEFNELSIPKVELKAGQRIDIDICQEPFEMALKVIGVYKREGAVSILANDKLVCDSFDGELQVLQLVTLIELTLNVKINWLHIDGDIMYKKNA